MRHASIIFLASLPALGCPGVVADESALVPLDQYFSKFATAQCSLQFRCCTAAELASDGLTTKDACLSDYETRAETTRQKWSAAVASGASIYSGEKAAHCFAAYEAGGCEFTWAAVCDEVLVGSKANGAACQIAQECPGGRLAACKAGVCATPTEVAAGQSCADNLRQCVAGLYCDNQAGSICKLLPKLGKPCAAGAACAAGLSCSPAFECVAGEACDGV